jgi:thiol-disulfide isomerase/thioredoxin
MMRLINLNKVVQTCALHCSRYTLCILFCFLVTTPYAQNEALFSVNISDPAPPLRVSHWLKGEHVQGFEKGKVYVVELWATWCKPCLAAMPHLSKLAQQYKNKVTFIAMDVMEFENTSLEQVKDVVYRMGNKMNFAVAVQDSNFMELDWLEATGERSNGIPRTFVIDTEGRLAWIGHPSELDKVLPKIVNQTWNIKDAATRRSENMRLEKLDKEVIIILMDYKADQFKPGSVDQPDSILFVINEIVKKEPRLKYAPFIADNTFRYLLLTDVNKAYNYGKEVLKNRSYTEPSYFAIIQNINFFHDKITFPAKIYELGAEALQVEVDQVVYPEFVNVANMYNRMAAMYAKANNKVKAIEAQQKAIEALKSRHLTEMTEFEDRLQGYKEN